jgi:sugar (pentulose or hexulose) kinase
MEGITYSLKSVGELMGGVGAAPKKIIASGGGASSAVWTADPGDVCMACWFIRSPARARAAHYGAAMLAGIWRWRLPRLGGCPAPF